MCKCFGPDDFQNHTDSLCYESEIKILLKDTKSQAL